MKEAVLKGGSSLLCGTLLEKCITLKHSGVGSLLVPYSDSFKKKKTERRDLANFL